MWLGRKPRVKHQRHASTDHVRQGRSAAIIIDVLHLDPGVELEHLAGEVRGAARAWRGKIERRHGLLSDFNQLGNRIGGKRLVRRQHGWRNRKHADRSKILQRVVGKLLTMAGLMKNEAFAMRSVYPSGGALATVAVATMVPAPGRFSTTTVLPPHRAERSSPSTRANKSVGPPAAKPTTKRTGRAG